MNEKLLVVLLLCGLAEKQVGAEDKDAFSQPLNWNSEIFRDIFAPSRSNDNERFSFELLDGQPTKSPYIKFNKDLLPSPSEKSKVIEKDFNNSLLSRISTSSDHAKQSTEKNLNIKPKSTVVPFPKTAQIPMVHSYGHGYQPKPHFNTIPAGNFPHANPFLPPHYINHARDRLPYGQEVSRPFIVGQHLHPALIPTYGMMPNLYPFPRKQEHVFHPTPVVRVGNQMSHAPFTNAMSPMYYNHPLNHPMTKSDAITVVTSPQLLIRDHSKTTMPTRHLENQWIDLNDDYLQSNTPICVPFTEGSVGQQQHLCYIPVEQYRTEMDSQGISLNGYPNWFFNTQNPGFHQTPIDSRSLHRELEDPSNNVFNKLDMDQHQQRRPRKRLFHESFAKKRQPIFHKKPQQQQQEVVWYLHSPEYNNKRQNQLVDETVPFAFHDHMDCHKYGHYKDHSLKELEDDLHQNMIDVSKRLAKEYSNKKDNFHVGRTP